MNTPYVIDTLDIDARARALRAAYVRELVAALTARFRTPEAAKTARA